MNITKVSAAIKKLISLFMVNIRKFISWFIAKDSGQETSFLTKAISSGNTFLRATLLLLITFFLLKSLALTIIDRFVVQVDEIAFSSEGNPIIRIRGKQELRVISVPAYQGWISSGITFSKDTKISIRANGSVATGLAVPRYLEKILYDQFKNGQPSFQKSYSELGWRLSKLEFNEDGYLGWRDPVGKLLQEYELDKNQDDYDIYGSKCIDEMSKQKKLKPELPYGVLLGFVAENDYNSAKKVFTNEDKDKEAFFIIGKNADIDFDKLKNEYRIKYLEYRKKDDIEIKDNENFLRDKWEGRTLYFTINDTVVKVKKELGMFTDCEAKEDQDRKKRNKEPVPEHMKKYVRDRQERYEKIYDKLSEPETIWYMDNQGDFTVTIITTQ